MTNLLNFLKSLSPTVEMRDAAYLADSVDICDLERRLREIDGRGRGEWSPIAHGLYAC